MKKFLSAMASYLSVIIKANPLTSVIVGLLLAGLLLVSYQGLLKPGKVVGVPDKATQEEAQKNQAKGAADELRKQADNQAKEIEALKAKAIELEKELKDAQKQAEDARIAYQKVRNSGPRHTHVDGDTSTDGLCARAKQLGVPCE